MSSKTQHDGAYWRRNLRLVGALLAVWFIASFGLGILAVKPLNTIHIGGFPLGFWFAQQGAILVFVVLVFVYARRMDRIERDEER
jgi:putative solute:sodium symporter small subunit